MSSQDGKDGKDDSNVNDLFAEAHAEGVLSPSSLQTLTGVDLGAQIQAGLGISVDDVQASEVVLLTIMPDDSGSIRHAGNEDAVREGHNLVLDALTRSKQGDGFLAHTRYLNGTVLFPYRPIDQAVPMTVKNYEANQGTPLYDQSVVLLGSVVAKAQEFTRNGVAARSVTLIITDGADQHSVRANAKDVAALVRDMTRSESHIVAAMGISDGSTDFREVFREMGIEDRWILTPGNNPSEIRKAFQVFSQSAVRASQAASFSSSALGGFTN
ncbi:MAG TPA: hypothetical protein VN903_21780 [Polyangia bacterium]|jgi:hypothetical protein|nr:hypothetical protein [Polyangia bacterium]